MNLKEWASQHPDDLIEERTDTAAIEELEKVAYREILDADSVRSPEGRLGHSTMPFLPSHLLHLQPQVTGSGRVLRRIIGD